MAYGIFLPPGLSLRWYAHLLEQPAFGRAFLRSLAIGVAATGLALATGVPAALALVRGRFPGRDALQAFLLSPIVMPKIVLGVGWFIFFARLGIQGGVLPLILAHTIIVLPFVIGIVAANLVGLDPTLEEAAQDLGASRWTAVWRIVLPQIRSGLVVSALLAFLGVVRPGGELDLPDARGEQHAPHRDVPLHGEVAGPDDRGPVGPPDPLRLHPGGGSARGRPRAGPPANLPAEAM